MSSKSDSLVDISFNLNFFSTKILIISAVLILLFLNLSVNDL